MARRSIFLLSVLILITVFGSRALPRAYFDKEDIFLANFFEKFEDAAIGEEKRNAEDVKEVPSPGAVKVPILVYHIIRPHYAHDSALERQFGVEPLVFEKELQYLSENGYSSITPDDLVRALTKGTSLPAKPVMLTFDDGWAMQYRRAFPWLKKYHFKATFYVFTNVIDHKKHFFTWAKIRDMDAAGMIIGGHTKSHPYLAKITDEKILREEINGSKKILEEHLGHPITTFAVPFGRSNSVIASIAKEAGFTSLRTMYGGEYHAKDDLMGLKSFEAPDDLGKFIELVNK